MQRPVYPQGRCCFYQKSLNIYEASQGPKGGKSVAKPAKKTTTTTTTKKSRKKY